MNKLQNIVTRPVALLLAALSTPLSAALLEFHFTGQYTLLDPIGGVMDQQPIESTLTYDTVTGLGASPDLSISNFDTFGSTATIYDITLAHVAGTSYIIGNMLADWNISIGVPVSMVWDASGLINAIDFGLQVDDVISGTELIRNGGVIADVSSAIPASDGLPWNAATLAQGPAPLAVTTLNVTPLCNPGIDCIGNPLSGGAPFTDDGIAGSPLIDGPFLGLNVNFDIGSGNSLTVLSITAVPLPAAFWLFGAGLIGLAGLSGYNKAV
ncbi:MAG: VPLPA-CTERM sorting domain-containing protein [Pseudomonadota bacterium]